MSEIKNIQAKIDMALYARLKNISRIEGKSIKEIMKNALSEYINRREGRIKDDPLFKIMGRFETKEGNWSERKDWR